MKTTVTVSKPCIQSWNAMQPNDNGRFCQLCQKTVTDFTTLSDTEIHRLIKNANGNLCGRFLQSQIDRPLQGNKTTHVPFGKFFLGLSLATIFNNTLQAFTKHVPAYYQTQPEKTGNYNFSPSDSLRILKVKLLDSTTKETIPFANVLAYSAQQRIAIGTTNIDGIANLNIPDTCKSHIFNIKAVYVGYNPKLVTVDISKDSYTEIYLSGSSVTIDPVVLTGFVNIEDTQSQKPTLWMRVKNIFKRKN